MKFQTITPAATVSRWFILFANGRDVSSVDVRFGS